MDALPATNRPLIWLRRYLSAVLCDLALEFGSAEALDSLLLRPALMYAGLSMIPSLALGIVFGQVAADIVFYVPTIVSYELLRRRDARRAG